MTMRTDEVAAPRRPMLQRLLGALVVIVGVAGVALGLLSLTGRDGDTLMTVLLGVVMVGGVAMGLTYLAIRRG